LFGKAWKLLVQSSPTTSIYHALVVALAKSR
jgi:hypothetical protein